MQFFIADVRKRMNADSQMTPHAVPESRDLREEKEGGDAAEMKNYKTMLATFSEFAPETPDDPMGVKLAGCEGITMEWTAGASEGQIDFYGAGPGDGDEPSRFLTLYFLSGRDTAEDKRIMKRLESYADFSQCLNFPLVLSVVEDPLTDASHHQRLQALRPGIPALSAAFLKAYYDAATAAAT